MIPVSFEFFPPRTDAGLAALDQTQKDLLPLLPTFYSVTSGAGGITRNKNLALLMHAKEKYPQIPIAPHITCVGATRKTIAAQLAYYQEQGFSHLVVLRGDLPFGAMGHTVGDFRHAADLVRFIRKESGQLFHISVAAYPEKHPEVLSFSDDMRHFAEKVEAGADTAITQFFFSTEAYYHFCRAVEQLGVRIPIIPGIMPINQFTKLKHFASLCGSEIPRWLTQTMQNMDEAQQYEYGIQVVVHLCHQLIMMGAPSLHFYTLNRSDLSLIIVNRLGDDMPT